MFDLESEAMRGLGSILNGNNIFYRFFFHVVKPLMPPLALLPTLWENSILSASRDYICLTSLTRAKWNFPLNFRTMRKLSDLYSGIFQNSLTCAKWNFLLNFRTMRKLSDLYSGIFQTQSSRCASGVDLFRNFTKLKSLNI